MVNARGAVHHRLLAQTGEVFLNLVMEYVPQTVYRVCRDIHKAKKIPNPLDVKVGKATSYQ